MCILREMMYIQAATVAVSGANELQLNHNYIVSLHNMKYKCILYNYNNTYTKLFSTFTACIFFICNLIRYVYYRCYTIGTLL